MRLLPITNRILSSFRRKRKDCQQPLKCASQLDEEFLQHELPPEIQQKIDRQICTSEDKVIWVAPSRMVPPLGAVITGYLYYDNSIAGYTFDLPSQTSPLETDSKEPNL